MPSTQANRSWFIIVLLLTISPLSACYKSGVGGQDGSCNMNGVCAEGLLCCEKTDTCLSPSDYNLLCLDDTPDGDVDEELEKDKDKEKEELEEESDGDLSTDQEESDGDEEDTPEDGDFTEEDYETFFPTPAGEVCSPDGICWGLPWPTWHNIRSIWNSESDNLWFAGDSLLTMRSDRESFIGSSRSVVKNLHSISGQSDNDVWAVGDQAIVMNSVDGGQTWTQVDYSTFLPFIGTFNGVFCDGVANMYVFGEEGALFRYYDEYWEKLNSTTSSISLNAMWGTVITGGSSIFVIVGDRGKIIFSTNQRTFQDAGQFTTKNLNDVHGKDPNEIIAVGDSGTVLFYDGSTWYDFPILKNMPDADGDAEGEEGEAERLESINLLSISGIGHQFYIVGEEGRIFRLVPGRNPFFSPDDDVPDFMKTHIWVEMESPTTNELYAVQVQSHGEVYVAGERGSIWATAPDQDHWYEISRLPPHEVDELTQEVSLFDFTALNGFDDLMYGGFSNGDIYFMDGAASDPGWTKIENVTSYCEGNPVDEIWVAPNGEPYFFEQVPYMEGENTTRRSIVCKLEPDWKIYLVADIDVFDAYIERASAIYPSSEGVYAVGSKIVTFDGAVWEEIPYGNISRGNWHGVWAMGNPGEEQVWVVGEDEDFLPVIARRSLVPWLDEDGDAEEGPSEDDYHWYFEFLPAFSSAPLYDVWGSDFNNVWMVGGLGQIYHWDGDEITRIEPENLPTADRYLRIWGSSDGTNLFITTASGRLIYSGNAGEDFVVLDSGFPYALSEMWGASIDQVYLAGQEGAFLVARDIPEEWQPEVEEGDGDVDMDLDEDTPSELESDLPADGDGELEETVDGDAAEPDLEIETDGDSTEPDLEPEADIEAFAFTCDTPPEAGACTDGCFCWSHPVPQGKKIRGVSLPNATRLWTVGNDGSFLAYNGTEWTQVRIGGEDLLEVKERAIDEVYLLSASKLQKWNGTALSEQKLPVTNQVFRAMDLDGSGNLFVLQDDGTIFKLSSGVWSNLPANSYIGANNDAADLWARHVSSSRAETDQVVVAGDRGIYRFNGSTWTVQIASSGNTRVHGFPDSDTVYVTSTVTLYRCTTSSCSSTTYDSSKGFARLSDIWGTAETDLYLAGATLDNSTGVVYRKSDATWSRLTDLDLAGETYYRVNGSSSTNVYFFTDKGRMAHGDGATWSAPASVATSKSLNWVLPVNATLAFAGGNDNNLIIFNGALWSDLTPDAGIGLSASVGYPSAALAPDGLIYVTTTEKKLLVYDPDGGTWDSIDTTSVGDLADVLVVSSSEIYSGPAGHKYNGSTFTPLTWDGDVTHPTISEFFSNSNGEIYAVCPDGLLQLNGTTLDLVYPQSGISQIAGDDSGFLVISGVAVGGTEVHVKSGAEWVEIQSGLPENSLVDDLYVLDGRVFFLGHVGSSFFLAFRHNQAWNFVEDFPTVGVTSVNGYPPDDLFVSGENGMVLHFRKAD